MNHVTKLINEMITYFTGDAKRINHFIKVHSFAKIIMELEEIDSEMYDIIEVAALTHDIGIKVCEEKYNTCSGKYQEIMGPAVAKKLLMELGYDESLVERVCYLVGHHHTYTNIDGVDYQILVEADLLVNIYEKMIPTEEVVNIKETIFKTKTGIRLLEELFLSSN